MSDLFHFLETTWHRVQLHVNDVSLGKNGCLFGAGHRNVYITHGILGLSNCFQNTSDVSIQPPVGLSRSNGFVSSFISAKQTFNEHVVQG